jgi:hypothetical protein
VGLPRWVSIQPSVSATSASSGLGTVGFALEDSDRRVELLHGFHRTHAGGIAHSSCPCVSIFEPENMARSVSEGRINPRLRFGLLGNFPSALLQVFFDAFGLA